MAEKSSNKGAALLVGAAFAVTASITACNGPIRASDLKSGNSIPAAARPATNPNGWTIIRNSDGAQICREHREDGKLDDEGATAAVITYDPSTGAESGHQHWKHGKRAEPPLPFAPKAPF
ncbi:MAG TPA: hypothetical protein VL625_12735 [Patescibacteria group bacterium]|jgi:hypothetical protein|nr:hypothetical protein [Patescibacteria group bacterium]